MLKRVLMVGLCPILLFLFSCKKTEIPNPITIQYHTDGEITQLSKSEISTPVNIVILGDGFQKSDLIVGGEFELKARLVYDYLFSTPPFNSYKEYFNVYQVSSETNIALPGNSIDNNTKFGWHFKPAPNIMFDSVKLCKEYAKKAIRNGNADIIILLINTNEYGNGGIDNINIIATGESSLSLLLHRIGHSFANLGDEYISSELTTLSDKKMIPAYPNLDVTNDVTKVKWSSYIKLNAYKTAVGIYEGGYYVAKGVYRPEGNSVMLNALTCSSYNAPSREAIARRICKIAGIAFNLNDFLEKDKMAIQPRPVPPPLAQPVITPGYEYLTGLSF